MALIKPGRLPSLPFAIAAELPITGYAPWALLYDYAQVGHRRHRFGDESKHVVCSIRVDEPMSLVEGSTVPLALRDDEKAAADEAQRAYRQRVGEAADAFIRGEPEAMIAFDFEAAVLTEVARRLREATADGFLLRALETTVAALPGTGQGA